MPTPPLIFIIAAVTLLGLMVYVVLAGADFGGGVWDLFATGPRRQAQRDAIAHAMGPVWESNHVWLIFVVVVLFTCFPIGYRVLTIGLFVPLHLALLGIILRGAAFVFRAYGPDRSERETLKPHHRIHNLSNPAVWQAVFGGSSMIAPFLLGAAFGAVTSGGLRVNPDGQVWSPSNYPIAWLSPYSIGCGLLALSTCAYLAAVYLVTETDGPLREDFRRRAILAGTTTAALALAVLVLARSEARWFYERLIHARSSPILLAGLVFFGTSAWAVFRRRYRLAPIFAAGEIVLLLLGWGLAHQPYLVYPDVTLVSAAAPASTLRFVLWSLPMGMALVAPSLLLLFHVFKRGRA